MITLDTHDRSGKSSAGIFPNGIVINSGAKMLLAGFNVLNGATNVRFNATSSTDGTPMIRIGGVTGATPAKTAQLFYLPDPPVGSFAIWVPDAAAGWFCTLQASGPLHVGTPVNTGTGTPYSNPESLSPLAVGAGSFVVDILGYGAADAVPTSKGSSQTLLTQDTDLTWKVGDGGVGAAPVNLQASGSYLTAPTNGPTVINWGGTGITGAAMAVAIDEFSSPMTFYQKVIRRVRCR